MIEGHGMPRFDDGVLACAPPMTGGGMDDEPQWDELGELMNNCGTEYEAIGGDEERYLWSK